jgi:uncharacterized membrane protein
VPLPSQLLSGPFRVAVFRLDVGRFLMLFATVLAFGAAVLHAGWNFAIKQSGDRFLALWGQFLYAGVFAGVLLLAVPSLRDLSWRHASLSGVVHGVYVIGLSRAYNSGDFSLTYPLARGGGALLAAVGGAVVLHDKMSSVEWLGAVIILLGLLLLTRPSWTRDHSGAIGWAILTAVTIGIYSVNDAQGSRVSNGNGYVLGGFIGTAVSATVVGVVTGRTDELRSFLKVNSPKALGGGLASLVTYAMVLAAVRHAPVGYVSAIRECSVVLGALAGIRFLGEGSSDRALARNRIVAAGIVVGGLIVLVLSR